MAERSGKADPASLPQPRFNPGFSLVDALEERALFRTIGCAETAPIAFRQSIGDYIEQFHSTATLARELMTDSEALDFDQAVAKMLRPYVHDGAIELTIVADLTWGRPQRSH